MPLLPSTASTRAEGEGDCTRDAGIAHMKRHYLKNHSKHVTWRSKYMAQIPKGRLVKGSYKPICLDCAIHFLTAVKQTMQKWKTTSKNRWNMRIWRWCIVRRCILSFSFSARSKKKWGVIEAFVVSSNGKWSIVLPICLKHKMFVVFWQVPFFSATPQLFNMVHLKMMISKSSMTLQIQMGLIFVPISDWIISGGF